jgi:hypothetical protein
MSVIRFAIDWLLCEVSPYTLCRVLKTNNDELMQGCLSRRLIRCQQM